MAINSEMTPANRDSEHEIDLKELFFIFWNRKLLIISIGFLFSCLGVWYAKSLPDIYVSQTLLAPSVDRAGVKVPGNLGGLAALAGVNLGGGGGDKTVLAIEILKSREFIGRFIEKYDLFVPLMAVKNWVRGTDSLVLDEESYDAANKKWVRKVAPPFKPKPSLQEGYERFIKLLGVGQDQDTGFVSVSIEHFSPYIAKEWVDLLVSEINNEMRERELVEAKNSIDYLNQQIAQTNIADVRRMLFSLIEEQTKTVMLASVRNEYVFKTIDSAVVPESKAKPKRAMIVILFAMVGGLLSLVLVLTLHFGRK